MAPNGTPAKRPRLAAVVTAYRKMLHPQHIVDRFLEGYGWNGKYHYPQMDMVSLYVDQRGEGDVFQERADRHPTMKIYPTIEEAITLGTGKLAVDGVVVVGEHGTYPKSDSGIMMHPHYEFFEQITAVFRKSGRSVPYFNDKELSWKWEWCKKMVDVSHELNFPLQGGSVHPQRRRTRLGSGIEREDPQPTTRAAGSCGACRRKKRRTSSRSRVTVIGGNAAANILP